MNPKHKKVMSAYELDETDSELAWVINMSVLALNRFMNEHGMTKLMGVPDSQSPQEALGIKRRQWLTRKIQAAQHLEQIVHEIYTNEIHGRHQKMNRFKARRVQVEFSDATIRTYRSVTEAAEDLHLSYRTVTLGLRKGHIPSRTNIKSIQYLD